MIGTQSKPFDELMDTVRGAKNVGILGCGDCAAVCRTGGEEQVKELAEKLTRQGITVVHTGVIDVGCDKRLVKKHLREYANKMGAIDALIVLACGSGVQTAADCLEKKVVPGLNSMFIGQIETLSRFNEKCSVCGDCLLADTGGICPVTLCAKGLVNGPCGGSDQGKCEANRDNDCAWYLIYERLKKLGGVQRLHSIHKTRSHKPAYKPRKIEIKR
jgi:ferredoxin